MPSSRPRPFADRAEPAATALLPSCRSETIFWAAATASCSVVCSVEVPRAASARAMPAADWPRPPYMSRA
nr:hypothetical protein [Nonomuraea cavernae]